MKSYLRNVVVVAVFALFVLFVTMGLTLPAFAITVFSTNDGNIPVVYDEPTLTRGGDPLDDLASTRVTFTEAAVETVCSTSGATSLNGGGNIQVSCVVPINPLETKFVDVQAYAADTSGNESFPSDPISARVDTDPPAQIQ